jgi:hypothetical protein
MPTANPGVISVHNSTPVALFTTTTDQFGKTVYGGARSLTVIMDTTDVSTGANVAYNSTTGVFSLNAGVTYQLTASSRLINSIPDTAALQWIDRTLGGTVGQPAKFDAVAATNVTYYKPASDTTVVLTAAIAAPGSSLTWSYPAELTNVTAAVQAVSGWVE